MYIFYGFKKQIQFVSLRPMNSDEEASAPAVKDTSIAAKIGLFYYYCFNMSLYGGQMSGLAAFSPDSLYPVITFLM